MASSPFKGISQLARAAALCLFVANPPVVSAQDKGGPVYGPPAPVEAAHSLPVPPGIPDSLARLAELSGGEHPIVRGAKSEREALYSEYRGAKWLRFPSLSVEALAVTEGNRFGDDDGITANAALEQPIWSGGRIGSEIQRARASWEASEGAVGEARQQILLETVEAYFSWARAEARVEILSANLDQHRDLLASIDRRVKQEVSPLSDFTLGKSRTAQVELDLASSREEQRRAINDLRELTGGPVTQLLRMPAAGTDAAPLPTEEEAVTQALECSPLLKRLDHQIEAARANRKAARSSLFPQVLGQVSHNELTGTRLALVLRAQSGNGLSQLSAIDSAAFRIDRAVYDYASAERDIREQLRRDYIVVHAALERLRAGGTASETSQLVTESYRRQFLAGRRSWLDVMNAVREASNSRLSEADARYSAQAATARILLLTCNWQPDIDESEDGR